MFWPFYYYYLLWRIPTACWSQKSTLAPRRTLILCHPLATKDWWDVCVSDAYSWRDFFFFGTLQMNWIVICRWRGQHGYCLVLASRGTVPTLSFLWFPLQAGPPWAAPLNTNHSGGTKKKKTCLHHGCVHRSVAIIYHVNVSLKYTPDLPCSGWCFSKGTLSYCEFPFSQVLRKNKTKKNNNLDLRCLEMLTLTLVDVTACCNYI